ncbi:single Ig IL-1-related receptor isoform X1 [Castor canadensis]|uniref:Single Ig IL-1-related receptor isoform X1 n=3 Tax=Castor canadensis TaxID=51338 RepID=A0AC58KTP0_CASCN
MREECQMLGPVPTGLTSTHGTCDRAPDFLSPSEDQALGPALGSAVSLNCTARVVSGPYCPQPSVQWLKDGLPLPNGSHYSLHEDFRVKTNFSEVLVSSILGVNLTNAEDYGAFTCSVQNVSSFSFTLWRAGLAGHVAAVLASLLVLLALLLAALLYLKCRLNVLLWYQDAYGEVEMNDGKLYDAYVSYSDSPEDRKFVNFILKPQLERRRGYKLFLDDRDLLPRAEPSADLLVNLSRCRRLIVVLSDAFLGRAWCSHSFREGLCRLLELTRRPIFITFESQKRDPTHPALHLLRQHRHLVTLLLWKPGSVTPSSDFWKELQLALPRKVQYRPVQGDPQTQLQDDKDPMLIVQGRVAESRALERELDPDPEGDLGMSTQTHYYDCLSLWRCLDPRPPWELPGLLVPLWLGVSVGLSLGSRQLQYMQVGSCWERAVAARWTSLISVPETTVPVQTSTAWCLRTMCSPHPNTV